MIAAVSNVSSKRTNMSGEKMEMSEIIEREIIN